MSTYDPTLPATQRTRIMVFSQVRLKFFQHYTSQAGLVSLADFASVWTRSRLILGPKELWVGILFSTLFGLTMLIHIGLLVFYRGLPKFMIVAVVAAAGELAGWIARTYGHVDPFNRDAYIAQIVCLILSPAFISAVNYMAFQNVMDFYGSKWSRIPRKYYVIGFCIGDLCSLVVQAIGGALSAEATTQDEVNLGKNIAIAGVSIQVAVSAPFMFLYLDYSFRRLREWGNLSKSQRPYPKLEIFNAVIGISTLFILIRCIYRIVEMSEGWLGRLATTPVYFNILDALMILLAVGIFIPFYPAWLLPPNKDKGAVYNAAEFAPVQHFSMSDKCYPQTSTAATTTPVGSTSPSSYHGHSQA